MLTSENFRTCFCEPVQEILQVAKLLDEAVSAHISNNRELAEEKFIEANNQIIWDWADSIMGKNSPYIQFNKVLNPLPKLSKKDRIETRMPDSKIKNEIHKRDGYNCRFCGIPVIRKEIRNKLVKLYPNAIPWGKTNHSRHKGFLTMWAQYDHILPHSRGGDNSLDNMILTCAACNFGRMNYTLDEVGLLDPRKILIEQSNWDGLERLLKYKS